MAKSRNFSIYLLKDKFNASNALKDDNTLSTPITAVNNLPKGALLYISDNTPVEPWWKGYWGIGQNLPQVLKGAIVFLPVEDRVFALTFGHTYHNLKNDSYEYDFGLRTTLNAVDPDKIRSTDIVQPEDSKRERIQSPVASDLNFFDINTDESIVKRLAGNVKKEYASYFKHATGANNIRISSTITADKIEGLCSKLLDIYKMEDYKTAFPDIQNIIPVKDPIIVNSLDSILVNAFLEDSINLVLSVPEIINHDDDYHVVYTGAHGPRRSYDDVYIGDYREFLELRDITISNAAQFSSHRICIKDDSNITKFNYTIYQSFIYDCQLGDNHYHLSDGVWYRIDKDYIRQLKESLDPYFFEHPVLKECNQKREDDFNKYIESQNPDYICLDKENISPDGQSAVEPCDIYTVQDGVANLIHIKISTRSSTLSHLFNQGANSMQLLRLNQKAREKLKNLVNPEFDKPEVYSPIENFRFSVTYGIITAKSNNMKSDALPIFSRISLRRIVQTLKLMATDCNVVLIKDNVIRKSEKESD